MCAICYMYKSRYLASVLICFCDFHSITEVELFCKCIDSLATACNTISVFVSFTWEYIYLQNNIIKVSIQITIIAYLFKIASIPSICLSCRHNSIVWKWYILSNITYFGWSTFTIHLHQTFITNLKFWKRFCVCIMVIFCLLVVCKLLPHDLWFNNSSVIEMLDSVLLPITLCAGDSNVFEIGVLILKLWIFTILYGLLMRCLTVCIAFLCHPMAIWLEKMWNGCQVLKLIALCWQTFKTITWELRSIICY